MALKRLGKKFIRIICIIVGSLLILLTAFHFWFVHHAEDIIEDLVASKSNGKLKLSVKNFKFNWFSKKMELEDAVFYSTDSATAGTTYRFAVKEIKLRVNAVMPILFEKEVLIDKLSLQAPDIVVTRLRSSVKDTTKKPDISLTYEMGRIYNSIQDALQVLQVKKFEIENAKFSLINKTKPDDLPIHISHIDFHIDNLNVDTARLTGKEKIFFSDNVVLKSRDQDILFPDRRHRLTYRKFRINIEKKIVEFDSCTIAAIKTDSASTGFSIYFDALQMTNIDFDTLYRSEVIKADSVYCVNPRFNLTVDLDKRASKKNNNARLDRIIRQLTGNLMLNFVVVNNASFDINTLKNGKPSSFTSSGNNFEMQGLQVNNDAKRPLRVEKLAMSIRNYENFLRDSQYALQFDSILVNNDKIYLNDFAFQQLRNGKVVNRFEIPRFQLTGLSWDDLLFERKLTAQQAILFNPVISYTDHTKNNGRKSKTVFEVLADMNEIFMLEDLQIVKGKIDLSFNGNVDMQLDDATLSVESRSLLGSDKLSSIRRSVNHLDFSKGYIRVNDLMIRLNNITYTGDNSQFLAGNITVINDAKTLDAKASNIKLGQVTINEKTGDLSVSGMQWHNASINMTAFPAKPGKNNRSFIHLTDIKGNNTQVAIHSGNRKLSLTLDRSDAIAIMIKPGEKPIIAGLDLAGSNLLFTENTSRISAASFTLNDLKHSQWKDVVFRKTGEADSGYIRMPAITFTPDVQAAIMGQFNLGNATISKPYIDLFTDQTRKKTTQPGFNLPAGTISKLAIEQPSLHIVQLKEHGKVVLNWDGNTFDNNSVVLLDVKTGGASINAGQLVLALNNFLYENANGKRFNAGQGEIAALINNLEIKKNVQEETQWKAVLASLEGKNLMLDSLGKKGGRLSIRNVQLKDLNLRDGSLLNIRKLVSENKQFRLQQITGSYTDSINTFKWFNAAYDKNNKTFSTDSFSYTPSVDRDAFVKNHPFQADYIRLHTKAIEIGPFDLDSYLQDTILRLGSIKIDSLRFDDYRDNRSPFQAGIFKPLMTDRIKKIPVKLSVDTLQIQNAAVLYAEVNPKNNLTAEVPVTRMSFRAFPIRNFDLLEEDSLRIQANGYLLDSIWVRIRLRESYVDSLAGFLLTVRMKKTDMRVLNPILLPLASARIKSGQLDTLSMRVSGNDAIAFGKMEMDYHDLKIQIVRDSEKKKKLLTGLLNFIANTFIVKNKNKGDSHYVFYIRNRDRSSINYLIKMVTSGVTNSVGVKSNKKIMRQYKKELRQRNLPPVDYD